MVKRFVSHEETYSAGTGAAGVTNRVRRNARIDNYCRSQGRTREGVGEYYDASG